MTDSRFLDSSAWLSYFYAENEEIKIIVESETMLLTSAISIFEIKNKLTRNKAETIRIQKLLEFIKKRSLIINLDYETAEKAVDFSIKNSLHSIDALIYSSALKNMSTLITLDNDFKGIGNVEILKR